MHLARRVAAAAVAGSLVVALAGCGTAPWEAVAAPVNTPTPTTTASAEPPAPVPNDLSGGSTRRTLQAGAVSASIDYWSDLTMDRWTADAIKPLSLSLVTTITPDDGQQVYLQRAVMTAVPYGPDGALGPLPAQVDTATVSPGYLVLAPYSYSQTFNVGSVPAEATYVQLQVVYDFLVQTTPTSSEYAKQTASETVTVAIAQPAAEG